MVFYYPVLTDVTALFVSLLALLFYVEKRPIALFATTIVGAFSWQIVSICGALLLFFPRTNLPTRGDCTSEIDILHQFGQAFSTH